MDVAEPKKAASEGAAAREFLKQIDDSAAAGYSVAGVPMELQRPMGALALNYVSTLATVMRPVPPGSRTTWRLLRADSLPELLVSVNEAAADGFVLASGGLFNGPSVLMERPEGTPEGGSQ